MQTDPFIHMSMALEIEEQSAHPAHKVGALICGRDPSDQPYLIARANYWPPILEEHIGRNVKLGNASTTVHAEIAAICAAPAVEGSDIYITDLPCPNCAKAMAESRIKAVYIDSHTHNTPLGLKIKPYFDTVSLPILKHAGIAVYEMNTQIRELCALAAPPSQSKIYPVHRPVTQHPLSPNDVTAQNFLSLIEKEDVKHPFAACIAFTPLGSAFYLSARPHRSIGLSEKDAQNIISSQDKYTPILQPLNRLLLTCARYGLKINPDYLYSSQCPTSREFVNIIGAGYTNLHVGNPDISRNEWGLKALKQLKTCGLIKIATS